MERTETVETTIGDLVAALTAEVRHFVRDEREANILVAHMISHLICRSAPKVTRLKRKGLRQLIGPNPKRGAKKCCCKSVCSLSSLS